jgi:hypothetical protein
MRSGAGLTTRFELVHVGTTSITILFPQQGGSVVSNHGASTRGSTSTVQRDRTLSMIAGVRVELERLRKENAELTMQRDVLIGASRTGPSRS